ncbi:MAG: DUF1552 domain-containing protein [Planctomycetota bacterium]|nr:DUF1552 domain-containing protein [Planctomycetota bacterium]
MLLISNNLGVIPTSFFPSEPGRAYSLSPYLSLLRDYRHQFTVFSGLSHLSCAGGHSTENCFLTGAKHPTSSGFRNTISLDQYAALYLGQSTRYRNLNLGVNIDKANRSLSWTQDGTLLAVEDSPARLFRKLFVKGSSTQVNTQLSHLARRGSILDAIGASARQLQGTLGGADRRRLDQYFSSIRQLEKRLHQAGEWQRRPKPTAERAEPDDIGEAARLFAKSQQMLEMAVLALQTDSTRLVTLMIDAFATPAFNLSMDEKTTMGYHALSHHGLRENYLAQLDKADRRQMDLLNGVLKACTAATVGEGTLLDATMILYGSNMGDANTHDNSNLPILLAGGGLRHGSHQVFDSQQNTPLCNLYLTMLQHLGIATDRFGPSTGTLPGLR